MREIFNQADIDANRQGKLSPAQVEFIKSSANPKVWTWGTGICFVLVGVVYFLSGGFAGTLGFMGWLMGLVLLFCVARWWMIWNLRRKLLIDQVTTAEGSISFKKLDIADTLRYTAETTDRTRLLPQGLAGLSVLLPPGDYRFYYLPTRKWLLSSEPLSSEDELKANLVEVLGSVCGFDPNHLANLRAQAAIGEVKTVEGQVKIETPSTVTSEEDVTPAYAEIGGLRFMISPEAVCAFIPQLLYRIYYSEDKPTNFTSNFPRAGDEICIAGIEPL